jgi:hypothetical protein
MISMRTRLGMFGLLAAAGVTLDGCSGTDATAPAGTKAATPAVDACAVAGWCTEHGVPEEICAQCDAKLAAEYQQKGDWCREHNRPESQCFLCNPKLEAKFAAEYEAKHGKKPPKSEGK